MRLFSINTGYFKLDGGAMFGVVPKSMWNKANPADENNMCTWAMRALLVQTDDRLILIDNGMGNKQDDKFFSHYYPHGEDSLAKNLARYGFTTNDITDVFLTHLHFDHCGGSIERVGNDLVPVFENATYWSDAAHWKSALEPNEREKASFLKENILPIEACGKLKFVSAGYGEEWIPGISILRVHGHTESMMLPLISYGDTKVLFCADLLPSAAHISLPWVMAYDMQPLQTLGEKRRILKEAVDNNWILFFEHDPKIECCNLMNTERGIRMQTAFNIADHQLQNGTVNS